MEFVTQELLGGQGKLSGMIAGVFRSICHDASVQSLLHTIAELMREKNLPGLMIGGHAVTALGHPRATFDLDLLIPRTAAGEWNAALRGLRYSLFAESENFRQYEAAVDLPLPPIDLMLVDADVYAALVLTQVNTKLIAVPSVEAMIALKLHAARQPARADAHKDWSDIIALFAAHSLKLDDVELRAMVVRHGGESAVRKIEAALASGNGFPHWPGAGSAQGEIS